MGEIVVFSGSAHPELAAEICSVLGVELAPTHIQRFSNDCLQVQLRATVLKTVHGDEVLIPNADVYTTAITNTSRYQQRRHDIPLILMPTTDLAQTRAALILAVGKVRGVRVAL